MPFLLQHIYEGKHTYAYILRPTCVYVRTHNERKPLKNSRVKPNVIILLLFVEKLIKSNILLRNPKRMKRFGFLPHDCD